MHILVNPFVVSLSVSWKHRNKLFFVHGKTNRVKSSFYSTKHWPNWQSQKKSAVYCTAIKEQWREIFWYPLLAELWSWIRVGLPGSCSSSSWNRFSVSVGRPSSPTLEKCQKCRRYSFYPWQKRYRLLSFSRSQSFFSLCGKMDGSEHSAAYRNSIALFWRKKFGLSFTDNIALVLTNPPLHCKKKLAIFSSLTKLSPGRE